MGIHKTLRKLSFSVAKKDQTMHTPESNSTQNDLSFRSLPPNAFSSKFQFAPSVSQMEEWLAETTRSIKKHFPEHIKQSNGHRKTASQDYKSWFMLNKKSSVSAPLDSYKSSTPNHMTRSRQSINSKNYHLPPTFSTIEQPPVITTTQINPHCKLKRSYHKLKKVTPANSVIAESAPCYSFMVEHTPLSGSRTRSKSFGIQRNASFSEDVKLYEKSHLSNAHLTTKSDFIQNFETDLIVQQVAGAPVLTSAYSYEDNHKCYKRYSPKDSDDSFSNFCEDPATEFDIDHKGDVPPVFHRALSLNVDNYTTLKSNSMDDMTKSPNRHTTMPALRSMSELGEIIGQAHKIQRTKSPPVQTNGAMRTTVINPPITCPLFQPVHVTTWESQA